MPVRNNENGDVQVNFDNDRLGAMGKVKNKNEEERTVLVFIRILSRGSWARRFRNALVMLMRHAAERKDDSDPCHGRSDSEASLISVNWSIQT